MDALAEERLEAAAAAADRGEPPPGQQGAPSGDAAQPGAPSGDAAQPGAPLDESALWIEAAVQYGQVMREMVPERAKPHWTPERLQNLGVALARCAKHYGWRYGAWATHPLAGLAFAAIPLAWPIAEPYVRPWYEKTMAPKPPPAPVVGAQLHPVPSGPAKTPPIG